MHYVLYSGLNQLTDRFRPFVFIEKGLHQQNAVIVDQSLTEKKIREHKN